MGAVGTEEGKPFHGCRYQVGAEEWAASLRQQVRKASLRLLVKRGTWKFPLEDRAQSLLDPEKWLTDQGTSGAESRKASSQGRQRIVLE